MSLTTLRFGPSSANPGGHVPAPPHNCTSARFGEIDLVHAAWTQTEAPWGP